MEDTFSLASRRLFVANGRLADGSAAVGERATAQAGFDAPIAAVEFVLLSASDGRENLALCFRCRDEAELARWRAAPRGGDALDVRPATSPRWELWRQDDNGNRVMIRTFSDRGEAEADLARFEALHHKQTYWLEERPAPSRDAHAG